MSRGEALLEWYAGNRRDLPWRRTGDPYRILVSEVMLQQTAVNRVTDRYEEFVQRFPDAASLADARLAEVLECWDGLGYPGRARRLREAAKIIHASGWPRSAAELEALPGVGPYTAAAVASIAFGERVAAVDVNVRRVLSRWRGHALRGAALRRAAGEEMIGDPSDWNQAVMELGALVCRSSPDCGACPVDEWCEAPGLSIETTRQAPYRGSMRQVRGDVLRALGRSSADTSVAELAADTGHSIEHVRTATTALAREGLLEIADDRVSIAA